MNGAVFDLVLQFLPVLAGMAFIVAIRRVAIPKDRLTIVTPDASVGIKAPSTQMPMDGEDAVGSDRAFEREAYDALLVNGLLKRNMSRASIRKLAFRELGMADLSGFPQMHAAAKSPDETRLTLFVRDGRELVKRMLDFEGDSGILLQYLSGYGLGVRVI